MLYVEVIGDALTSSFIEMPVKLYVNITSMID